MDLDAWLHVPSIRGYVVIGMLLALVIGYMIGLFTGDALWNRRPEK